MERFVVAMIRAWYWIKGTPNRRAQRARLELERRIERIERENPFMY